MRSAAKAADGGSQPRWTWLEGPAQAPESPQCRWLKLPPVREALAETSEQRRLPPRLVPFPPTRGNWGPEPTLSSPSLLLSPPHCPDVLFATPMPPARPPQNPRAGRTPARHDHGQVLAVAPWLSPLPGPGRDAEFRVGLAPRRVE